MYYVQVLDHGTLKASNWDGKFQLMLHELFLLGVYSSLSLSIYRIYRGALHTHCTSMTCPNLLMCMWQTWEPIKAQTPAQQPWFFSLAVSALRESKQRHKVLSVSAVCLDLTLVMCVRVCATWVCVCARICVANHIKERRSCSAVVTSDPGVLRYRGRVAE